VRAALRQIEQGEQLPPRTMPAETTVMAKSPPATGKAQKVVGKTPLAEIDDGRRPMHKLFVESKIITAGDFDLCWSTTDLSMPPGGVVEPFIQVLSDKGILPVERSLKVLCDKSRFAFLPLKSYETDTDLARSFPAETCQRWCVLPFDRISKSILVATANPFNQQAQRAATFNRLLWYLCRQSTYGQPSNLPLNSCLPSKHLANALPTPSWKTAC
jgi:hypothetical protein